LPENQGVEKKRWQKWHLKTFKVKNLYREDAKYAKKQQTSPDFLSSFALFAGGGNAFTLLKIFTAVAFCNLLTRRKHMAPLIVSA
jgi:hypothetical protein